MTTMHAPQHRAAVQSRTATAKAATSGYAALIVTVALMALVHSTNLLPAPVTMTLMVVVSAVILLAARRARPRRR